MLLKRITTSLAVSAALAAGTATLALADENEMIMELADGEVTVELRPDLAPQHVARIQELVRSGAYDDVAFHRVIEGFMAQTGDVQYGDMAEGYNSQLVGTGGSDMGNLPAEFSDVPFERGIVGMARAQDPDSANSQFFIMFAPAASLDNQYTVVGEVTEGMEHVDAIKRGNPGENGMVVDPDRIIAVRLGDE